MDWVRRALSCGWVVVCVVRVCLLAAWVLVLCAPRARAQGGPLVGKITMAKEEYLAGEPVYVHFEVTNVGKEAVQYTKGDPYANGCGGYEMEVSREASTGAWSCARRVTVDCLSETQMLAPGETERQNILVNFANNVTKPGEYEIGAVRSLRYWPVTGDTMMPADAKIFTYQTKLKIQVEGAGSEQLKPIYQVYVRNLESQDDEIQRDAERAIASGAQPWLEDTIVGMLRRSTSREFALLGLKNLNTPRARQELAKIVKDTSEETTENVTAVEYLGEMGDKAYFPLLLELAKKEAASGDRAYVLAAAQLGGEAAVPFLKELLVSKDANVRTTAAIGLGKTGNREAAGVLVESLKGGDAQFQFVAGAALGELTHQSNKGAKDWQKWWEQEGQSAKIYGPKECGE
jgi:HEAT repeat protein